MTTRIGIDLGGTKIEGVAIDAARRGCWRASAWPRRGTTTTTPWPRSRGW